MVYDLISSPEYGIPDSSLSASSVYGNSAASKSRLNIYGLWFPSIDDDQKRINVDFGENRLVLAIRTRTANNPIYNIKSFMIYTGIDGSAALNPVRDNTDAIVVFEIDENATVIVNHPLPIPVIARYVALEIILFDVERPGIRWAVDGCAVPTET